MLSLPLAADGGVGGLPLADLGQYGLAGILLGVLLIFGRAVVKAEKTRADEAQAKYEALQTKVAEQYVPSMEKWAAALAETQALLREVRADRAPPRRRA